MAEETQNADSLFSWNLPRSKYLDIKLYNTDAAKNGLPLAAKIAMGAAGVLPLAAKIAIGAAGVGMGAGGAFVAAPFVLAGIGLSAGTVVAGSFPDKVQAAIGNVTGAGGSLFSKLQSAGAAGLGFLGFGAPTVCSGAPAGAVGGINTRDGKKSIPISTLEQNFKKYMKNKIEIVTYEDLEHILEDLDLSFGEDELKEKFNTVTGRTAEGPIIYEEFLRLFGVKIFKGEELERMLTEEFSKTTILLKKSSMTFTELETMLKSLGATVQPSDIEESFDYVSEELGTAEEMITLDIFLEMCGCRFYNNFDLEMQVIFFEQYMTNEKIDIKELFNIETTDAKIESTVLSSAFLISLEEYLTFFDFKLKVDPLKAALTFKSSLLYFDFMRVASATDMTISVSDAESIMDFRGYMDIFLPSFEKSKNQTRLNFREFLMLFGTFVDYWDILKTEDYIINPVRYIYTSQVQQYFNLNLDINQGIDKNILKEMVSKAIKDGTGDETERFLSYVEFVKVLLVFDSLSQKYSHVLKLFRSPAKHS